MKPEQQAAAMERMTAAIIVAIDQNGGAGDVQVIIGSLGAAAATIAKGRPGASERLDAGALQARNERHKTAYLRSIIQAVKDDPMACHSIAVWTMVDEALLTPGTEVDWGREMPKLSPPSDEAILGRSDA